MRQINTQDCDEDTLHKIEIKLSAYLYLYVIPRILIGQIHSSFLEKFTSTVSAALAKYKEIYP